LIDFDLSTMLPLVIPFALMLARVAAFCVAGPLFSWNVLPVIVRAGLVVVLTIFMVWVWPPAVGKLHWMAIVLMLAREIVVGLVLGLAARLVFLAVQQGGVIAAQAMGLADAEMIDPMTDEDTSPITMFFEFAFILLFLAAGGHHLLLAILMGSYQAFPVGHAPTAAAMADALVSTGSTMLLLALKFAAPMLAAYLMLSVILAVVARVLPDVNILFESYPVRVGLGLLMAAAVVPGMADFTQGVADWLKHNLV
jgi:flagellar biosynthetic protein FliR